MEIENWKETFDMDDLKDALPKKEKIYGIPEGTRVKHSLVTKSCNMVGIVTRIGIIKDGKIVYGHKTYIKPSHFVKSHHKRYGGRSLSGFEMEVEYEDGWIPYSIYCR